MNDRGYEIEYQETREYQDNGTSKTVKIFFINLKLTDLSKKVKDITSNISDESWINKLGDIDKASYGVRFSTTCKFLIEDILRKISNPISEELGELLVTHSAKDTLEYDYAHKPIPIAELWHAKKSGNPSFDFHSVSELNRRYATAMHCNHHLLLKLQKTLAHEKFYLL
jgi:hypothetical protein